MKSERYKGRTIYFVKKYKYISRDYPSSPYVIAYLKGGVSPLEIGRGFTKDEAFENAKRIICCHP